MKLNKTIRAVLAVMLIMTMVLGAAGCGKNEQSQKPYDYNLDEYINVGEYKGLEYTAFEVEVTDEEVEAAIDEVMASFMTQTEVKEGIVKTGDYVQIKYTIEVEGVLQEGTDAQSYIVKVGESGLMPDVDKALTGAEVGSKITVDTVFAEDYDINPDFAGKKVKYEIEIQSVVIPEYQELTDEFAKENLGTETADEYRELIKEVLQETELAEARYAAGEEIWAGIMENAEVLQYPEKEVEELKLVLIDNFNALCEQNGMTSEEALADILEINEEEFMEGMQESAEGGVKEKLILYKIARDNDLELSEKEIDNYLDSLLNTSGLNADDFADMYGMTIREYAEQNNIISSLLYEAVFAFLVDNGTAK